ncbi:hypothetical protein Q4543_17625 [Salipiger sp. 1_MG-2023]|uniref:hypothetical protein n=1 Tax=Salipiger sp. 1_MG-2023 TaxID=3062665 RepID=UPI0026E1C77F|nr:hypothetical protein [Salipiger sp. 1_MG-2023]MDO6587335.1 hypothetical protein [Salipiger sp. 1_MG-2023]
MPDYLSVADFKAERRIEHSEEDARISRLLDSAEQRIGDPENGILRRPVIRQEFSENFDSFEDVELAHPDGATISGLTYESAGVSASVTATYTLEDGRLRLAYGETWPASVERVSVTYDAGWSAEDVPEALKDIGYFIAGQMYDNADTFDAERFRRVLAFMASGYRRAVI